MTEITKVFLPNELEEAKSRMLHINFDCIVKAFDYGFRQPPSINGNQEPQWFKLNKRLTLEFVKTSDERTIGRIIKEAMFELEKAIEQYEKKS